MKKSTAVTHTKKRDAENDARKVTQHEVASAANVSQTLVSLVLNGEGKEASEEVRQRVLQVATHLRYTPLRRRRKKKGSKLFALIRPLVIRGHHSESWIYDSYEQFYLDRQEQLRLVLKEAGYELVSYDDADMEATKQWLEKWEVAGVFLNTRHNELIDWIRMRLPAVDISRSKNRNIDCVTSDDIERVSIAFDHLHENGHRRISFLRESAQEENGKIYFFAYTRCCEKYGLPCDFIDVGNFEPGVEEWAQILAQDKKFPDAIIGNPIHLLILQKHFIRLGIKVPGEISLASIDNISACRFLEPALASIDLNFPAIAETALKTLLTRIESPDRVRCKVEILPTLVPGGSVGKSSKNGRHVQLKA